MKNSRISLHRSASFLVLSGWVFAFLVGFAPAAESIPINFPGPEAGRDFRTPAQVWDEALPLGNGTLGALLWGDGSPLKISLDRADLWDLRKVPEFYSEEYDFATMKRWHLEGRTKHLIRVYEAPYDRPAPTKIPAGRLEIQLGPSRLEFVETTLSPGEAIGRIDWKDGSQARVLVHATRLIGLISIRSESSVTARLVAPDFAGKVENPASGGIAAGDLTRLGYPAPHVSIGEDHSGYLQEGAQGFRFVVYLGWKKSEDAWLGVWSVASTFEDPHPSDRSLTLELEPGEKRQIDPAALQRSSR